jgi:hypothetical protein
MEGSKLIGLYMLKVLSSDTETGGTVADSGVELVDVFREVLGEKFLVSGDVFRGES